MNPTLQSAVERLKDLKQRRERVAQRWSNPYGRLESQVDAEALDIVLDALAKAQGDAGRLDFMAQEIGDPRWSWGYYRDERGVQRVHFMHAANGCDPVLSYATLREAIDAARTAQGKEADHASQ